MCLVSVVCSGESSIQTAVLLQLVGRWNNKRCTVHSSKKASLAKSNYRSRLCAAPSPVRPLSPLLPRRHLAARLRAACLLARQLLFLT